MSQLSIIHTVGSLGRSAGGPTRTVTTLCREIGRLGARVDLMSLDVSVSDDENLLPPAEFVTTTLAPAYRLPYFGTPWSLSFRAMLSKRCEQIHATLIHDHGVWLPTNRSAAVIARKLGIPLIVSTRGMLEPWALNHRAWKKRLAWSLYQRQELLTAGALHATAQQEADNLRRLGLKQPIAIIPNGVDLPVRPGGSKNEESLRTALFLSRIHPKKGLLQLVDAWQIIRPIGWRMIIAGPDEGGHRAEVEQAVHAAGLSRDFEFVGAVDGPDKEFLYRRADLFVLPSFSENFGVVVAEALAHCLPVITTRGTPWADLETHGCGWWIDIGVEPLALALRDALSLEDDERRAMGERGQMYVQRYNWGVIACQMVDVYRWVLGRAPKPDCVQMD